MRHVRCAWGVLLIVAALAAVPLSASGPVAVYGLIEKVVFEPSQDSPERAQVWGAFAYVDGGVSGRGTVSPVRRGYLYFTIPRDRSSALETTIRNEWRDLKTVAGTNQAVAFGDWLYIGTFDGLDPSRRGPSQIYGSLPGQGETADMRVRPASEPPANPTNYRTNVGVVKVPAQGSRAELVRQLQQALRP